MTNKEKQTTGTAPTHFAYHVSKGGERSYWTRIGAAWANKDGNGFNIQLESYPIDGRITLRTVFDDNSENE